MKILVGTLLAAMAAASLEAAVVYGHVLNEKQQPVAGTVVYLESKPGKRLEAHTDSQGKYRFDAVPESTFSVRAGGASAGPFTLSKDGVKEVSLTLASSAPDFFDEPKFVVAGVTAGSYQGGHGSDVVLRSADALRKATAALSAGPESGDAGAHHLLAAEDEKSGKYLEAAREYQRAAELDSSEPYLFDWGTELLRHHADEQAVEVFTDANRRYPGSVRVLLGLAATYYARGTYDKAAKYFFAASDLDPVDPAPYLFLGKTQSSAITQTTGFRERMERFQRLRPDDAQAQYLYGVALWSVHDSTARVPVERAIQIDPKLGPAYLLLGTIDDDGNAFVKAAAELERAVSVDPALEEAHYRLAQLYRRMGDSAKARRELANYEELRKESANRVEKERSEMQQFVIDLRH